MITIENIASHELIGQHTEIIKSSNESLVGMNGIILDETKNMFTLKTDERIKFIPKSINHWKFTVNNQEKIIKGTKITKRPFERIGVKV